MAAVAGLGWLAVLGGIVGRASPYALAVNIPYALAFLFVGGEVAWLARRPGGARKEILLAAATATAMAGGAFVVGFAYTAVFRSLWALVATLRWEPAANVWRGHPVPAAMAAFVMWDCAGWIYHLIGHRTRLGWAAHSPHHSGAGYDATLGLRQSWLPFHGLVHLPLLALFGFDIKVVIVCAAASNCWQVLEHTSLPVRFPGWLSEVVMTPAAHRHHHRREGAPVNMGPVFTCWDRLAGTWVPPHARAPDAYGPVVASSTNPIRVELTGWVQLFRGYSGDPGQIGGPGPAGSAMDRSLSPEQIRVPQRPAGALCIGPPLMTSTTSASDTGR